MSHKALIDDPSIAATGGLLLDRLFPALTIAFDAGADRYPDDDASVAIWMNGVIYGLAAHLMVDATDVPEEKTPILYATLCELVNEMFADGNDGSLDRVMQSRVLGKLDAPEA